MWACNFLTSKLVSLFTIFPASRIKLKLGLQKYKTTDSKPLGSIQTSSQSPWGVKLSLCLLPGWASCAKMLSHNHLLSQTNMFWLFSSKICCTSCAKMLSHNHLLSQTNMFWLFFIQNLFYILCKNAESQPFVEPNQHVLTFFHPKFVVERTSCLQITRVNQP